MDLDGNKFYQAIRHGSVLVFVQGWFTFRIWEGGLYSFMRFLKDDYVAKKANVHRQMQKYLTLMDYEFERKMARYIKKEMKSGE